MDIYQEAQALGSYLTELRREFHRHPEVSRKETWTAERIEAELDALGITEHKRVDGSGERRKGTGSWRFGPIPTLCPSRRSTPN